MNWNVFDAHNNDADDSRPQIQNYDIVVEGTSLLENHHEIPVGDDFPHTASITCPCHPNKTGNDQLPNGKFIFFFLHQVKGGL